MYIIPKLYDLGFVLKPIAEDSMTEHKVGDEVVLFGRITGRLGSTVHVLVGGTSGTIAVPEDSIAEEVGDKEEERNRYDEFLRMECLGMALKKLSPSQGLSPAHQAESLALAAQEFYAFLLGMPPASTPDGTKVHVDPQVDPA